MDRSFLAAFILLCDGAVHPRTFCRGLTSIPNLIRNHIALCDKAEKQLMELRPTKADGDAGLDHDFSFFDSRNNILYPSCRAAFVISGPFYTVKEQTDHKVILVLTGEDSRSASGPVNFDSLRGESQSIEILAPNVARVLWTVAVNFVSDLEHRETLASGCMRAEKLAQRRNLERIVSNEVDAPLQYAKEFGLDKSCRNVKKTLEGIESQR